MPEGHVIHRLARAYEEAFAGRVTHSSSPQGRFAEEAGIIDGLVLDHAEAVGKHLFCHFGEHVVQVHLGMAGKTSLHRQDGLVDDVGEEVATRVDADGGRPITGAIRWRLETEDAWCDLRGPAICALVTDEDRDAVVARLGADPLSPEADVEAAWARVRRSSLPIAVLLMDQKVTAGVGNIFRAEVLYRARMDPMLPGTAVTRREFEALWDDLVGLMEYAVEHGRIDTVRPEHDPVATGRAPRVDRHGGEVYVYRRAGAPCHVCGTAVRTQELANRNLFWCPTCQPLSRRAGAVAARRLAREKARAARLAGG
ncbi:Fpg/Nei family DNA glycosylase [Agilicoccus flavus]|uniref:Fpg/Nei family DNA glycosylase n=1 Tax=Agilicoccus flavus TaxID=2775968 RepID=UPI001CF62FDD|nr:DNA-formamidopyrimidine glycosylase family protein [Agilicoccus flavus]